MQVEKTRPFEDWFNRLRDLQAKARISKRLERLTLGNLGDVKPVGEGVSELRIDYGPGYRVYFLQRGQTLIILLAGGDKTSQSRDIRAAMQLAREIKEEDSWPL